MMKRLIYGLALVLFTGGLFAQQNPVLFSVEGNPIQLSEFEYIYNKTNGEKANYSRESLQEYLDLYVKFKLKVQKAKELKLDTIPELQRELAGYRRQLANSYLVDKEVTEKLVKEAFDRTAEEVDISHIMIALSPTATPVLEAVAKKKIMEAKAKLDNKEKFEDLARTYSDDTYSKKNGGRLGYYAAMFREGFYEMETAAYSTPIGKYSDVIRTAAGYHIIKVNNKRPSRGEVEVGHILIRHGKDKATSRSKIVIDSLYQVLKGGADFEETARTNSTHKQTAAKGGYIGFVSTNSPVEESFKDASFKLTKDNEYTKPFESSVGWHIVRRISKKDNEAFDVVKRRLQTKIQNNARGKVKEFSRQELAKSSMLERIKKEGKFKENLSLKEKFLMSLDSSFMEHTWKVSKDSKETLFSFGDKMKFSLADFGDFCKRSAVRMKMGRKGDPKVAANRIYDDYVADSALKFEESQLEVKYPEFKSLMREYEEGILLFEATKLLVWDRASQDTTGLKAFHETRKDRFQWGARAEVDIFTVRSTALVGVEAAVKKFAANATSEEVLEKFNIDGKSVVAVQNKTYEKGKNEQLDKMSWTKGAVSEVEVNAKTKASSFMVIRSLLPPAQKTLAEARGYVIADYQDFLEKQWLETLSKDYKVEINQAAFEGLIK